MSSGSNSNDLCGAVAAGLSFDAASGGEKGDIAADQIRRLVLRLPDGEAGVCAVTAAGIEIHNARIVGRVELDKIFTADGGAAAPIEFHHCHLTAGFSGQRGHFSRLCFKGCTFGEADPLPEQEELVPTIDLSGAVISSALDMDEIVPEGLDRSCDPDPRQGPFLWVRLTGARIAGHLALSRSYLRAPVERSGRSVSDLPIDAVNLSLADLGGDVWFLHSTSDGGISGRGLTLKGDIWMSGAHLRRPGHRGCLYLPAARIGGGLMLDGCNEIAGDPDSFRRFIAVGEINVVGAQIGGFVTVADADLLTNQPDPPAGDSVSLRMSGARIGGPVTIGSIDPEQSPSSRVEKSRIGARLALDGMEVASSLTIKNSQIGAMAEQPDGPATISGRSLVAKRMRIKGVEPLLWGNEDTKELDPRPQMLSVNLDGARVERLRIQASRFSGYLRARPLTCTRDVSLDVWVGQDVDFKGSDIGGSLDISDLRVDAGLSLRDAGIGRALKFNRPPGPGGRLLEDLIMARTTPLRCLPDTTLIETLWRYQSGPEKALVCQVAFLKRRGLVRALDGSSATLDAFVAVQGHAVHSSATAMEYVRLRAAYAGDQDRAWIVTGLEDLPEFVAVDPEPPERQPAAASQGPAAPPASLEALDAEAFRPAGRREGENYVVEGCFLHRDRLLRTSFAVSLAKDRVTVERVRCKPAGPPLVNVPVARDRYTYHPAAAHDQAEHWVTKPLFRRTSDEKARQRLDEYETLLLPYVQPGYSIRGEVDLSDLSCDTLDDGGGRFWGNELRFHLDRFVYRQATWVDDPVDKGFRDWIRRNVNRLIAERAWPSLIDWFGWKETRLQAEDFWAPWQIRRNWIYQQFSLEPGLSSPTRHRVEQSEYRPQPFEQAIRVARNEGREDFAANFEILKRRIEWSLFSLRSRRLLLMIGIGAALAWLILRGGPHLVTATAMASLILLVLIGTRLRSDRRPFLAWLARMLLAAAVVAGTAASLAQPGVGTWERGRDFVVAVLILVGLRYLSTVSHWLMRNLFGYLRLPINAIVSLFTAFLLGWAAVELANDRGMLVIDVEPVASVVARSADSDRRVYVGTPKGGPGARNVACGDEIEEPLYALDVLIPLIDLRQENRCQVGRAMPFDEREPDQRRPVAYVVELLFGRILDSEDFWAAAKALYAIAGWFLVSLSILTFANANRPRGEPGG